MLTRAISVPVLSEYIVYSTVAVIIHPRGYPFFSPFVQIPRRPKWGWNPQIYRGFAGGVEHRKLRVAD